MIFNNALRTVSRQKSYNVFLDYYLMTWVIRRQVLKCYNCLIYLYFTLLKEIGPFIKVINYNRQITLLQVFSVFWVSIFLSLETFQRVFCFFVEYFQTIAVSPIEEDGEKSTSKNGSEKTLSVDVKVIRIPKINVIKIVLSLVTKSQSNEYLRSCRMKYLYVHTESNRVLYCGSPWAEAIAFFKFNSHSFSPRRYTICYQRRQANSQTIDISDIYFLFTSRPEL